MSDISELRERLRELREQVTQEAELRASVDRDLGDLKAETRANGRLLRALAQTQSEHTAALSELTGAIGSLADRVRSVDNRLTDLAAQSRQIVALLNTLIDREE